MKNNFFFRPEEEMGIEEILLQKKQARQNARVAKPTKIKLTIKEETALLPANKAA